MKSGDVVVELGSKRVFASALAWPGWSRSGRDEESALQGLRDYAVRYADAVSEFTMPSRLTVVERVKGNSTTDFGAPGVPADCEKDVSGADLAKLIHRLELCWKAFDRAAASAGRRKLRSGPRGGGRDVTKMKLHVIEADRAYIRGLGGRAEGHDAVVVRSAFIDALKARAAGKVPDKGPRGGVRWSAAYAIRRSAWHALDHAWEIEDRLS